MSPAWVALGANLGDPRLALVRALRWLAALPETTLHKVSSFHRTAPVGPPQPDYLNAVALVATHLPPDALLAALQRLERVAGRQRTVPWGPRTLDLDLLLMGPRGSWRVSSPALALPHPRIHERAFVLAPLAEIDPELVLANGVTVRRQLASLARAG